METPTLKLSLYGSSLPSKKNSKQIMYNRKTNRPFIMSSTDYLQWHKNATVEIIQWKVRNIGKGFTFPITRCKMAVFFFFPDNRARDLDNKLASVMDVLVDTGVIISDKWQVVRPITMDAGISKTTPRVDIYITKADDEVRVR